VIRSLSLDVIFSNELLQIKCGVKNFALNLSFSTDNSILKEDKLHFEELGVKVIIAE
jgi:hypothetical protein